MKRRDRIDLLAEVLATARKEVKTTGLVYGVNSNFQDIKPMIQSLLNGKLLCRQGRVFKSTPEGLLWLRDYESLKKRVT